MGWNYRVIYHKPTIAIIGGKEFPQEEWYGIHEVYYDKKDEADGYAIPPIIQSESVAGLLDILDLIGKGIQKSVLEEIKGKKVLKVKEK